MSRNKNCNFTFHFPKKAEVVLYGDLTPEEKEALLLPTEPVDRKIYRFSIVVDIFDSTTAQKKYCWQSLKGVSLAIKIISEGVDFVSGLYPRKDHKNLSVDVNVGFEQFIKASVASVIIKRIPGNYWGVEAQRTDKETRWILRRKWIDKYDFKRFEVVCSPPSNQANSKVECGICAFRANSENVRTQKATVILS